MSSTAVRGRPSSATPILDTALRLLDEGASVSLDSVAKAAGLTKPGLMYHFPTKAALMGALVDHVVDNLESDLIQRLAGPVEQASAAERLRAYVQWALESPHRRSDLVMLADPKLADRLTKRWIARFDKWVAIPASASAQERAQYQAARLVADGAWLAATTNVFPLTADEQPHVLDVALQLLGDPAP